MKTKITDFGLVLLITIGLIASCKKDEATLPEPEEPVGICTQIKILENDIEFANRFRSLSEDAKTKDHETGFMLLPGGKSTFRYEPIAGPPGEASIRFDPERQVDGFIHQHYGGLYPNFSGADIRAIYVALIDEKINDVERFTCGVVSSNGIAYLLKITDIRKFLEFGRVHFEQGTDFTRFELVYARKQMEALNANGLAGSFEIALSDMLKDSGLTLFKGGAPFDTWLRIEKNSEGKMIETVCN